MITVDLGHGVFLNTSATDKKSRAIFNPGFIPFLANLHRKLSLQRLKLLSARQSRQFNYDQGATPNYLETHAARTSEWKIAPLPKDLRCRRVEITGPVNSRKMVINMLNRNKQGYQADLAMLDFEDSMKPTWEHIVDGFHNVCGAINGTLEFFDLTKNKTYRLNPDDHAKIMVRVRGLHLIESNILIDNQAVSAGLFDFAMVFYHTALLEIQKHSTPTYYIPKTEDYREARWWNELFCQAQKNLDIPLGTLRATFLIETLPAAFQMEEILYEFREHAAGLNVGRWDKIFSDIKVLRNHSDRILEDRNDINMQKPWMKNYAQHLVKICHKHGAMAIGGMSAFTPGKDATTVKLQTEKVILDKSIEAGLGHDGCWVSHPYFIGPAMDQFKHENQLSVLHSGFPDKPDLLPYPDGKFTLTGLRNNIQVGIVYQHGWNKGLGCVSWNNLMEDLATLEIARAQTWQWIKNRVRLTEGINVTLHLVSDLFDQEYETIKNILIKKDIPDTENNEVNQLYQAKEEALELFTRNIFHDFITNHSEILTTLQVNPQPVEEIL